MTMGCTKKINGMDRLCIILQNDPETRTAHDSTGWSKVKNPSARQAKGFIGSFIRSRLIIPVEAAATAVSTVDSRLSCSLHRLRCHHRNFSF